MRNLEKELKDNEVLVILAGEDYKETLIKLVKEAEKTFEKICFVTLIKPYKELVEVFKKENIDIKRFTFINASFIDSGQSKVQPPLVKGSESVTFSNSLSDLKVAIAEECVNIKPNLFIFDSLSLLLIYIKESDILRFVHYITQRVKMHKTKMIFIALRTDEGSTLIKDLVMIVDKVENS